jgi:catechol 2,3-dioxygenase-like lactoylglutathione lyase family enzyme
LPFQQDNSVQHSAFLVSYWYSIGAGADAIRPIFAVSWHVSRDAKEGTMVHTYGLTHINLVVRDVARSLRFYGQVFGVEEYGRADGLVHTRTPGCHDVITFDEYSAGAGESRGIALGFRLVSPGDIDAAVDEVERTGANCYAEANSAPASRTPMSTTRTVTKSKSGTSEAAGLVALHLYENRYIFV